MAVAALFLVGCDKSSPQPTEPSPPTNPAVDSSDEQPPTKPGETVALEAGQPTSERVVPKTFDDIKFDIEPDAPYDRSMLTDAVESLDGQRIRIRGFILPTARTRGLKQFVLVRDNQECCFGPGAALYDCILVEMAPGRTTEFTYKPVAVEGEFAINEFVGLDGKTLAIYRMTGETVEL